MNDTPQGERVRIVLLGRCNVGKSSLINAIAGQPVAIVSPVKGTTTDPVRKAMEILPIGPVLLCDTPGLDDSGDLGELRMKRTMDELAIGDAVLLVTDARTALGPAERILLGKARERKLPVLVVFNRVDEIPASAEVIAKTVKEAGCPVLPVSSTEGTGVLALREAIAHAIPDDRSSRHLVADLVPSGSVVVLVCPIDSAAPKGRLILPQQQAIRDLLEKGVTPIICRETELTKALASLKEPPALVVTDSQVFGIVAPLVPPSIPLTSFSILFARYKGDLAELIRGAEAVQKLKDGDRILMAEGCTHHRQGDDIGTVKIPRLLQKKTGKTFRFEFSSGIRYPDDLPSYALVVHCGACMLNRREMCNRIEAAKRAGVPIVNYGILLAYLNGILERTIRPIPAELR